MIVTIYKWCFNIYFFHQVEDIPLSYERDLNPCDGIIRRPLTKDSSNPVVTHMSEIPCVLVEVLIFEDYK